ncbi:hypothetical protein ACFSCV_11645 [Methylopila henanensis]|uniref:Uncharacterized protein n=1 Tax=Methylopila henanensis TaxID=873516 RepID=A0ABW4K7J6_9HYPH
MIKPRTRALVNSQKKPYGDVAVRLCDAPWRGAAGSAIPRTRPAPHDRGVGDHKTPNLALPALIGQEAVISARPERHDQRRRRRMLDKQKKVIVGALIAVVLAIAAYFGLVSQDTSDRIKTKTDEILSEDRPAQPSPAPSPAEPSPAAPAEPSPAPAEPPAAPAVPREPDLAPLRESPATPVPSPDAQNPAAEPPAQQNPAPRQ